MPSAAAPTPSVALGPQRIWAVVPCGGSGSRAGGGVSKQYRPLVGLPVLAHTLNALAQVSAIDGVVLAIAEQDTGFEATFPGVLSGDLATLPPVAQRQAAQATPWLHVRRCAGDSRAQTVLNALKVWMGDLQARHGDWVLVHDAARCLVTPGNIAALIHTCKLDPVGGLLGIPLPDTLKQASHGRVAGTMARDDKWLAQTPQMFRIGDLLMALESAARKGFAGITDESSAMELQGYSPRLVLGSPENIKLTYPPDFALAEAILKERTAATSGTQPD